MSRHTALLHREIMTHARETPDRVAVAGEGRRLTYAQLDERVRALAAGLRAAGVHPGDRVALAAENDPQYIVSVLAIWTAGGVLATVYPSSGPFEFEYVLANAEPRLVLVDPPREELMRTAAAGSGIAVHTVERDGVAGLPDAEPLAEPVVVDPDAPGLICYTSGTASRPKPVTHSFRGVAGGAEAYARVWHMRRDDATIVALPLAWAFGLITSAMTTLLRGGKVVVLRRYNPVRFVEAVAAERPTIFPGVTTMYVKLLRYVEELDRPPDLRGLRFCVSGGEPRNEQAFSAWRELTGCPVHDVYCSSECLPVVTYDMTEDAEPRHGSAGRVVPEADLRIVDGDGRDVPDGQVGEGLWRGPCQLLGYWNEPELTRAAMTDDGWYRSGDYVWRDEDGYVYVAGRVSDMIIRGGSNVSPTEVENVLAEHPDVAQVSVVGLPDAEYGQCVAAAIVVEPSGRYDPDALAQLCRSRLAAYKVPTVFARVTELPRNENGKVVRRDLAAMLSDASGSAP